MVNKRTLGKDGPAIHPVGLGCMGMSEFYGAADDAKSISVIHHAVDSGVNFLDTADMYGSGRNEELVGRAIADRRDKVVLATKFAILRGEGGSFEGISGKPEYVKKACDASLARLGLDHIDVYYQHRVDPNVPIEETVGAMAELVLGDPGDPATDVGPIIDAAAAESLRAYIAALRPRARLIAERAVPPGLTFGHYVAPVAFGIALEQIPRKEVFGPVLHIVRYRAGELDALLDTLNATGYGLTLGIQSRVDAFTRRVAAHLRAGNVYVNRNMIGAVVGVQPFGGEGLSGTGPKAGGPHTLLRYAAERTLSINTAAVGGNAQLLGED